MHDFFHGMAANSHWRNTLCKVRISGVWLTKDYKVRYTSNLLLLDLEVEN